MLSFSHVFGVCVCASDIGLFLNFSQTAVVRLLLSPVNSIEFLSCFFLVWLALPHFGWQKKESKCRWKIPINRPHTMYGIQYVALHHLVFAAKKKEDSKMSFHSLRNAFCMVLTIFFTCRRCRCLFFLPSFELHLRFYL